MADEQKPQVPVEKHLDDFKGTKSEQIAAKSAFISKYGFDAFEKLVQNSGAGSKR